MGALDVRVFLYLHHVLAPALWLFAALSVIGGGWGALVLVPMAITSRLRTMARFLAYTLVANTVFVFALKGVIGRVRPCNCLPDVHALIFAAPSDSSFPSGHTAGAFAFAVFFAVLLVRASFWTRLSRIAGAGVLLALALGVGLSRIALGVHFPGDVFAGAIIGATFGSFGANLYRSDTRSENAGVFRLSLPSPSDSSQTTRRLERRRLLRMVLTIATVTVVWLLLLPSTAFAMPLNGAPVCDARGATMFAPPPQIQDAELSLDIPADCFDLGALDLRLVKNASQGHNPPPQLSSNQEPMALGSGFRLDLVFESRVPAPVTNDTPPPIGVRDSLERPPRA